MQQKIIRVKTGEAIPEGWYVHQVLERDAHAYDVLIGDWCPPWMYLQQFYTTYKIDGGTNSPVKTTWSFGD